MLAGRLFHSLGAAIITLNERISKTLDTGKIVCSICIDFRKAYDVIQHKTLLKEQYFYGIRRENVRDWFESYLSERSQNVEFQNTQSYTKPITHGVPQGSILGLILFINNINDYSRATEVFFPILYADDTSVSLTLYDPGGGGALKAPPLRFFALTHLILELHYCALVTFPKK